MHDSIESLPGAFFLSFPEKKDFLISEIEERFPQYGKPVFYGDLVHYPKANICDDFSAADSADGAAASINRTLAPFDELNVVETQGKGRGGAGGADSVLSDLEQYLTGYDMLEFYTDSEKTKSKV